MFVELTRRPTTDAISVLVWSEGTSRPFDNFLREFATNDEESAMNLMEHITMVMEQGEQALWTSVPVTSTLQVIATGKSWLIFFIENTQLFICEQGHEPDEPAAKLGSAETRYFFHRTHSYTIHEKLQIL